mmetsp:Transcript_5157/g.8279  ORF Transcript_5157/g.8279 Transcript_5157/m.8279 type:complete len:119 (-) Transcript_5157:1131-1487(-)
MATVSMWETWMAPSQGKKAVKWWLLTPIVAHPCVVRASILSIFSAPKKNPALMNAIFFGTVGAGIAHGLWTIARQRAWGLDLGNEPTTLRRDELIEAELFEVSARTPGIPGARRVSTA